MLPRLHRPDATRVKGNLACIVILAMALDGCGNQDPTGALPPLTPQQTAQIESEYILPTNASPAALPVTARPGESPAPKHPQVVQPIQERLRGAIHAQLTLQLRMFVEKHGRTPETFSEFANSAMDSVPAAPEGMKFVIDPADRTVKAVKK